MLANLFVKNESRLWEVINSKALFQEISALFVALMGCLIVIPLSGLCTAWFLDGKN